MRGRFLLRCTAHSKTCYTSSVILGPGRAHDAARVHRAARRCNSSLAGVGGRSAEHHVGDRIPACAGMSGREIRACPRRNPYCVIGAGEASGLVLSTTNTPISLTPLSPAVPVCTAWGGTEKL